MPKKLIFSKEYKSFLQQKPLKVLLLGESCLDEYHFGTCSRISPEAPVPVFDFVYSTKKHGMAANVKQNLESFGCEVDFITNNLNDLVKRRFIDIKSNQQLLREDIGNSVDPVSFLLSDKKYDALVISDYDKGFLTDDFIENLCNEFHGLKFVDTKKTNLGCFKNCIIKVNDVEATKIIKHGKDCQEIITRGKIGASWNKKIFPAPEVELHDVTGAGDVFLASLCCIYSTTNNMEESIQKSVILASKSVEHRGIYKLKEEDIDDICD